MWLGLKEKQLLERLFPKREEKPQAQRRKNPYSTKEKIVELLIELESEILKKRNYLEEQIKSHTKTGKDGKSSALKQKSDTLKVLNLSLEYVNGQLYEINYLYNTITKRTY